MDLEGGDIGAFINDAVRTFSWRACSVHAQGKKPQGVKTIIDGVEGAVAAGELVALMGPSGSGKTTLLNLLAGRVVGRNVNTTGDILVDGTSCSRSTFRRISSYVEQEDALIGSLTARETVNFCARLSQSGSITSPADRRKVVDDLLASFGLSSCADVIIGTPLRKGISGGQKRRVSVAAQLVTGPSILFLDEPTSGLDSQASFEVVSYLKGIARKLNLIVIASIHQPSTTTFNLFDSLCLLGGGRTCYFGKVSGVVPYFTRIGHEMPAYTNPAEYVLDLINTDFAEGKDSNESKRRVEGIKTAWAESSERTHLLAVVQPASTKEKAISSESSRLEPINAGRPSFLSVLVTLLHRSFIKSYRDVLVFGVRLIMYLGLAVLMGTVWLRMDATQDYIQPFINAIFFGSAFMSFMAVAYIPAYIEDYNAFRKDRDNGLYGPLAFQLANFLIAVPYLFIIALSFSLVSYWLSGFRNTGQAFFTWVLFLFLDLLAAEGLVVLISSIFPVFVVALALTAFANGAWMATGGFLVPLGQLNPFYKYVFHYINYQAYVFQGMMVNEFQSRIYACGTGCDCSYPTMGLQCRIPGVSVLQRYSYSTDKQGEWIGILIAIIVAYRLLALGAVSLRKH